MLGIYFGESLIAVLITSSGNFFLPLVQDKLCYCTAQESYR